MKAFMKPFEAFKGFTKPFQAPQRTVKIKTQLSFFFSSGIETGKVKYEDFCEYKKMFLL